MGTNFFARRIPTVDEIDQAKEMLEKHLKGELPDYEFNNFRDEISPEIHLGKRSCGWQFHWHCEPDYYAENLDSIKHFLSNPEWVIYDEYGETFTLDQFINEEIGESMYSDGDRFVNAFSCSNEKEMYGDHSYRMSAMKFEHISKDGLRFSNDWFR